ncbi:hypothetical protein DICVIV_09333 [Dictyocaulus viviparus]|uniref:Uncharacterized protein n=1 Tax=Dictyocaulus viviparus TaxID=29172 RepID=A0A0D8XJ34_DICVI|nr:hypothetical protein DICVIV_09333 [Dictyocaulus viviparus]
MDGPRISATSYTVIGFPTYEIPNLDFVKRLPNPGDILVHYCIHEHLWIAVLASDSHWHYLLNLDMKQAASQLLRRVLMVPPKYFTVEYMINPWMKGTVNKQKAYEQWSFLKSTIEKEGVEGLTKLHNLTLASLVKYVLAKYPIFMVLILEPTPGLPDQVFVCNAGLVYNNQVYLSVLRSNLQRPSVDSVQDK